MRKKIYYVYKIYVDLICLDSLVVWGILIKLKMVDLMKNYMVLILFLLILVKFLELGLSVMY